MNARKNRKPKNLEHIAKQRLANYLKHPEQAISYEVYRKKWLKK